jgi:hypothetical protein
MQHNVQKTVEQHLKSGHDNIYLYNLGYHGKYSVVTKARYGNSRYDLGGYSNTPCFLSYIMIVVPGPDEANYTQANI